MNKPIIKDCTVAEQHPSTQGHFPGHPIVPGAYLAAVVEQLILEDRPTMRVASLRKIKFLKPLAPGVKAQLKYQYIDEHKIKFSISAGADRILEGSVLLDACTTSPRG